MVRASPKSCLTGAVVGNGRRVRGRSCRGCRRERAGSNKKRTDQSNPDYGEAHRAKITWNVPFHTRINRAPSNETQHPQLRMFCSPASPLLSLRRVRPLAKNFRSCIAWLGLVGNSLQRGISPCLWQILESVPESQEWTLEETIGECRQRQSDAQRHKGNTCVR